MKDNGIFNDGFIRSLLLMLEETDPKQYMELTYHVLMQNPSAVIRRNDPLSLKREGIDTLIEYFIEEEEYEKCGNLQKLRTMLLAGDEEV